MYLKCIRVIYLERWKITTFVLGHEDTFTVKKIHLKKEGISYFYLYNVGIKYFS
jgi:hypothetical protein